MLTCKCRLKNPQEKKTCLGINELKSVHGTDTMLKLIYYLSDSIKKMTQVGQSSRPSTVAHVCTFICNDDILEVVKECKRV